MHVHSELAGLSIISPESAPSASAARSVRFSRRPRRARVARECVFASVASAQPNARPPQPIRLQRSVTRRTPTRCLVSSLSHSVSMRKTELSRGIGSRSDSRPTTVPAVGPTELCRIVRDTVVSNFCRVPVLSVHNNRSLVVVTDSVVNYVCVCVCVCLCACVCLVCLFVCIVPTSGSRDGRRRARRITVWTDPRLSVVGDKPSRARSVTLPTRSLVMTEGTMTSDVGLRRVHKIVNQILSTNPPRCAG